MGLALLLSRHRRSHGVRLLCPASNSWLLYPHSVLALKKPLNVRNTSGKTGGIARLRELWVLLDDPKHVFKTDHLPRNGNCRNR